jgi:Zn-dependent M16 (insulinase) family peptidase
VGFAALSFPASPYGTPESAHEGVLAHWLSNNLLWERLRVQGGAYGAFAMSEPLERVFSLGTYRDPRPFRSLAVFTACLQAAARFPFDTDTLERAVTGAYSKEIQPRSPSGRGFTGLLRSLCGITDEMRAAKAASLLATTAADLRRAAEGLLARSEGGFAVVLGSGEGAPAGCTVVELEQP